MAVKFKARTKHRSSIVSNRRKNHRKTQRTVDEETNTDVIEMRNLPA